jgi:hypothetical protein
MAKWGTPSFSIQRISISHEFTDCSSKQKPVNTIECVNLCKRGRNDNLKLTHCDNRKLTPLSYSLSES